MIKTKLSEKAVEKIIVELAKKGLTAEKIGLELKKEYNLSFFWIFLFL